MKSPQWTPFGDPTVERFANAPAAVGPGLPPGWLRPGAHGVAVAPDLSQLLEDALALSLQLDTAAAPKSIVGAAHLTKQEESLRDRWAKDRSAFLRAAGGRP